MSAFRLVATFVLKCVAARVIMFPPILLMVSLFGVIVLPEAGQESLMRWVKRTFDPRRAGC